MQTAEKYFETDTLITRLRPIPEFTDTDTGSDVTAAKTSRFTLLCMSTEQACVVRVCMKIL